MKPFINLKDKEALSLRAEREFLDINGIQRRFVNDEYLFKGPGTYKPRIEESVQAKVEALIVLPTSAIVLKAKRDTVDANKEPRKAGEKVLFSDIIL